MAGLVHMYGGPVNPTTGTGYGTGQPMPSFVVTLLRDGTAVATAMSDPSGRYTFLHVSPGTYQLDCAGAELVAVKPGATTSIDCSVNVP